ncbi:methionyl-tRNA formyltransferase [Phormidium sp. CCY1219]|uniref:methionyl-tRNA formyltransferase n=1 Tax=Phormidium sp. CCY1219 TaxID=2886104 RepID=UPI002D1F68B4|nr:methionyl-tRNA formyltransferase [Phormidium sp. CCY1219]MEB3831686.1 methionyl-tRNA formyltransferase [Phormidium sp. CCY1219]
MKVVFFGTPQFAVPCLEMLLADGEIEVLAVVTQPDKRRRRGNQLIPSAVKSVALAHNLPVWQPRRVKKDPETLTKLRQSGADAFVVTAYGQILSPEILEMPPLGCINVHASLLPKYRGAAPIQWCLYNGEAETGVTTMLMDAGMDTGPMLLKAHTPIELLENAHHLAQTEASLGARLLVETLLKLKRGQVQPIPQDDSQASYAPLIKKEDYKLDWSRSAIALHNQIRGFFPNCVARFRGQDLKAIATAPVGDEYWEQLPPSFSVLEHTWPALYSGSGTPGEVVSIAKHIGPIVKTGEGFLLLQQVQLAGKRAQSGWDFANGTHLQVGDVFENG